jgi:hypothetical protein
MMMQKAAEMMFSIPLAKRRITDLESAIEQGAKAQRFVAPRILAFTKDLTIKQTDYSLPWLPTSHLRFRMTRTLPIRDESMGIT